MCSRRPYSEEQCVLAWGRDTRVDTLRGLFLIVMMVDHLPYHPLLRFSRQGFGFVSAAEGFVFVSGEFLRRRYRKCTRGVEIGQPPRAPDQLCGFRLYPLVHTAFG
jgi:hypothetical protein